MANLSNINNYFVVNTSGLVAVGDASSSVLPSLTVPFTVFKSGANSILSIQSGGGSGKPYFLRSNTNGSFSIYDDLACLERLTIASGGDVTIPKTLNQGTHGAYAIKLQRSDGTYQPFAATSGNHLYFYNNDAAGNYFFRNAADSSTLLTITNGGNVGIAETNPNAKLDVSGNVKLGSAAHSSWTDAKQDIGGVDIFVGSGSKAFQVWDDNDQTNARFIVERAGNVGIKTTSPDAILQIINNDGSSYRFGYGGSSDVYLDSDNIYIRSDNGGTNRYTFTSTGLGIGTTSPQNKLVVANGTGGTQNIEIAPNYIQSFNRSGSPGYASLSFYASSYGFNVGEVTIAKNIIFTDGAAYSSAASIRQQSSALIFSGGTNGYYFNKSDNSATHMFINSSGQVGIGTTGPNNKLEISDTGAGTGSTHLKISRGADSSAVQRIAGIKMGNTASNDGSNWIIQADSSLGYFDNADLDFIHNSAGTASIRMTLTSAGNLGIGTSSPSIPLQVHGQQKWYTTNADGNELRGFFNPGGSGDDAEFSVYKDDGATEGVVWRGAGNSYIRIDSTSLKFINFYYGPSNVGQIVTGGSNVLYQSNSDYRLKENVVEMTGALDRVNELKPSRYNFISHPEEQVDGFMAHELQEVVPQAVSGQKDEMNEDGTPKYQGVDHSQIVPLLVGAIKELKVEIEQLKTQINN